jgi:hypothetical protein
MTEFGVSALLEAEPVGLREARAEIEEELGDEIEISISGTRTTDLLGSGGGASPVADGGSALVDVATEQRDLLEDILDELETGSAGTLLGGGGGGSGGLLGGGSQGGGGGGLLSFLAGRGSVGLAGLASLGLLGTVGAGVGGAGLAVGGATQLPDPGGERDNLFTGGSLTFGAPPELLDSIFRDIGSTALGSPPITDDTVGVNDPVRRGLAPDAGGESLLLSDQAERLLSEGIDFSSDAQQTVDELSSLGAGTGQTATDQPGGGGGGVGVFDETRRGITPGAPSESTATVGVRDPVRRAIGGGERTSTVGRRDPVRRAIGADRDGGDQAGGQRPRVEATVRNRIETDLQLDDRELQDFLRDPERYIERVVERAFRGR